MNDLAALVARLLSARDSHVEISGATAAFAAISGTEIAAVMHSRGPAS